MEGLYMVATKTKIRGHYFALGMSFMCVKGKRKGMWVAYEDGCGYVFYHKKSAEKALAQYLENVKDYDKYTDNKLFSIEYPELQDPDNWAVFPEKEVYNRR